MTQMLHQLPMPSAFAMAARMGMQLNEPVWRARTMCCHAKSDEPCDAWSGSGVHLACPFFLPICVAIACGIAHELLCRWVLNDIGDDSPLAQDLFAQGNAWLGPKPAYAANPKLLRARYYLLWRPLPAEVADEAPQVRPMLWAARACGLVVPFALVWFWAQAFISAT